ncbi:MAG: hypothetical protein KGI54_15690 [Pseudomonadota bacterium]|nr:hypothetical protein [Pseudomonadota bacterium]
MTLDQRREAAKQKMRDLGIKSLFDTPVQRLPIPLEEGWKPKIEQHIPQFLRKQS